jgi:hypothetical protein
MAKNINLSLLRSDNNLCEIMDHVEGDYIIFAHCCIVFGDDFIDPMIKLLDNRSDISVAIPISNKNVIHTGISDATSFFKYMKNIKSLLSINQLTNQIL